jgi:hypothetical protein
MYQDDDQVTNRRHSSERPNLTKSQQDFLNILRLAIRSEVNWKDSCIIKQEFHDNVNHPFFVAKRFGEGNTEKGISDLGEQFNKVRSRLNLETLVAKWALRTIIVSLIVAVIGMFASGFITKIRG